jgi:hypothetical protein
VGDVHDPQREVCGEGGSVTGEELSGELVQIGKAHGGFVRPSDVVQAARAARNPLHQFFEWDNTKAAEEYRLVQARHLIRRVTVILTSGDEPIPIRAFISLMGDRGEGSYRQTVVVLSTSDFRQQALEEALAEMKAFQHKYRHLAEVAEVIMAMARTTRRLTSQTSKISPKEARA